MKKQVESGTGADKRPLSRAIQFTPVTPKRLFEEMCAQVRREMAVGNLKPGDKLPPERELAKQFATSRAAVREALRSLEFGGILELQQGLKGGAFIKAGDPKLVTQMLQDMLSLGTISLESLTEARIHIQEVVIRLASERASSADLDLMDMALDQAMSFEEARMPEQRLEAIGRLYEAMSRATENEILVFLVQSLTRIVGNVLLQWSPRPKAGALLDLKNVVKALRARDPTRAAAILATHFKELHEHILSTKRDAQVSIRQRTAGLQKAYRESGAAPKRLKAGKTKSRGRVRAARSA